MPGRGAEVLARVQTAEFVELKELSLDRYSRNRVDNFWRCLILRGDFK